MRTILGSLLVIFSAFAAHATPVCQSIFDDNIVWRATSTNADPIDSSVAATSSSREAKIQKLEKWQITMINGTMLGHADTPPMYFVPADGQNAVELVHSGGLHGVFTHFHVTGIGPSGILKGTLLLPVSGHLGFPQAQIWAKQDKYNITSQVGAGPQGDQFGSYNGGTVLVANGQSLDLITKQEVSIQLVAGQQVRVLYFRQGSGGPGGYPEGRVMIFTWDGN